MRQSKGSAGRRNARELVEQYIAQIRPWSWPGTECLRTPAALRILAAEPSVQVAAVRELGTALACLPSREHNTTIPAVPSRSDALEVDRITACERLMRRLLRRKLPFTAEDLIHVLDELLSMRHVSASGFPPISSIVSSLERYACGRPLTGRLAELVELLAAMVGESSAAVDRRVQNELLGLLGGPKRVVLLAGEAWSEAARSELHGMWAPEQHRWIALLHHAQSARGARPSRRWLRQAEQLIEAVGRQPFREAVVRWFPLVDKPRIGRPPRLEPYGDAQYWRHRIIEPHATLLKGLVWCCSLEPRPSVVSALGDLAMSAYRTLPGLGPRLVNVGNACVHALGQMGGAEADAQLALLRVKVRFGTAQKMIEKACGAGGGGASRQPGPLARRGRIT